MPCVYIYTIDTHKTNKQTKTLVKHRCKGEHSDD